MSYVKNTWAYKDIVTASKLNNIEDGIAAVDTGKQDTLTAGSNVTITNNTISATDTTYTAGTNVTITDGVISATGGTEYTEGSYISIEDDEINNTMNNGTGIIIDANGTITIDQSWLSQFVSNMIGGSGGGPTVVEVEINDPDNTPTVADDTTILLKIDGEYIDYSAQSPTQEIDVYNSDGDLVGSNHDSTFNYNTIGGEGVEINEYDGHLALYFRSDCGDAYTIDIDGTEYQIASVYQQGGSGYNGLTLSTSQSSPSGCFVDTEYMLMTSSNSSFEFDTWSFSIVRDSDSVEVGNSTWDESGTEYGALNGAGCYFYQADGDVDTIMKFAAGATTDESYTLTATDSSEVPITYTYYLWVNGSSTPIDTNISNEGFYEIIGSSGKQYCFYDRTDSTKQPGDEGAYSIATATIVNPEDPTPSSEQQTNLNVNVGQCCYGGTNGTMYSGVSCITDISGHYNISWTDSNSTSKTCQFALCVSSGTSQRTWDNLDADPIELDTTYALKQDGSYLVPGTNWAGVYKDDECIGNTDWTEEEFDTQGNCCARFVEDNNNHIVLFLHSGVGLGSDYVLRMGNSSTEYDTYYITIQEWSAE